MRILYGLPPVLEGRVVPGMSAIVTIDTGNQFSDGAKLASKNK